jgi:hypothetical protein
MFLMPYGFRKKEITLSLFTFKDKWGFTKKIGLLRNLSKYLLFALILSACGDDDKIVKLSDEDYFPLRTGFYQIYSVQKTVYEELESPQTYSYELRTEVVDSFLNAQNTYTYVIYMSTRQNENSGWQFETSWSARVNPYNAISTEGNVSYVRISFPPSNNSVWDGNSVNSLEADEYVIKNARKPYDLMGTTYPDCIRIVQEDEVNNLFRDQREEVYARNVGLIYKKSVVLNYCDDSDCFGQGIIVSGEMYEQELKSYGQN